MDQVDSVVEGERPMREAQRREFDADFESFRTEYTRTILGRSHLDARTGHLTLVGQFAATRSLDHLREALRAALQDGVEPRELLEVILQCAVYCGDVVVDPALDVFGQVTAELGVRLDQPASAADRPADQGRTDDELAAAGPRIAALAEKVGWPGLRIGLRLKPDEHIATVSFALSIDEDFARAWERFVYEGMYSRETLDHKTRTLCAVANFVALGSPRPTAGHVKGALHLGATPEEIREVMIRTSVYFGMPAMMTGLKLLVSILDEQGESAPQAS